MALVDDADRVVGPRERLPEDSLTRAARPGRVRAAAEAMLAWTGDDVEGRMREFLRNARHLHSWERRLVADAVYDGWRFRGLLEAVVGPSPSARYLGWLVWHGLDPEVAETELRAEIGLRTETALRTNRFRDLVEWRLPVVEDALCLLASVGAAGARALRGSLGEDTIAFLAASNQRAPTVLRARGEREEVAKRLSAEGVETRLSAHAGTALTVLGRANVLATRAWREGDVEVQDEASQLVAAAVEPTGAVLDFCAGAGGKALALAALTPSAQVSAWDVRPAALAELRRRAKRAGAAIDVLREPTGLFDRVLVDAPCTGSGVWRRHPSWRQRLERLPEMVALQAQILDRAVGHVKPCGWLVYATCSVLCEENEAQVRAFLDRHPGFALVSPPQRWAPHTHGTDGMFVARLCRS